MSSPSELQSLYQQGLANRRAREEKESREWDEYFAQVEAMRETNIKNYKQCMIKSCHKSNKLC